MNPRIPFISGEVISDDFRTRMQGIIPSSDDPLAHLALIENAVYKMGYTITRDAMTQTDSELAEHCKNALSEMIENLSYLRSVILNSGGSTPKEEKFGEISFRSGEKVPPRRSGDRHFVAGQGRIKALEEVTA